MDQACRNASIVRDWKVSGARKSISVIATVPGLAVPHLISMRTSFFQLYTFFTIPRPFLKAVKRFLRSSVRLPAGPFLGIQAF